MKEMLTDRVLAFLELEQDLLYGKIPEEKRGEYIEGSLRIGREKAGRYAGKDIFELYKQQGIAIVYRKETKGTMGVMLRGQALMSEREKRVELYQSSIESLAVNSSLGGEEGLSCEQALRIHLAHEFFHYLELAEGKTAAEELPPVPLSRLFGRKRFGHISRCSEIAAHAFAKAFLNLSCLPNAYDYFYLIRTGKMKEEEFDRLCRRFV